MGLFSIALSKNKKSQIVIPGALAILLTFGRGGFLPFEDLYTPVDQLLNYFVVLVAPFFVLKNLYPTPRNRNLLLLTPYVVLAAHVYICVFLGSPMQYWPPGTPLITIGLSILYASQITRHDLQLLRRFVLAIAAVFSIFVMIYSRDTIGMIFSGMQQRQLGIDISPANVIVFPRVMYILIITSFVSLVVEMNVWLRIISVLLMIVPTIIALATGGRGPLIGFAAAAIFFAFNYRKKIALYLGIFFAMVFAGYRFAISLLPGMLKTRLEAMDSGRYEIWSNALDPSSFSWLGHGVTMSHPHNIFLEFLINYGFVGLLLFVLALGTSLVTGYRYFRRTHDQESLWAMSLLVLQLTAQQFSLDIFYGGLWGALILPLGYGWEYRTRVSAPELGRIVKKRREYLYMRR